jgi:S1-C subfamily serine protease
VSLRIVHTFGHHAGVVTTLDKDVVRFGRAPGNDVVFDPEYDRDASGDHAELRREGGEWVLVDRGSRNGTFVGGDRIDRRPLRSGDEVTFGAKGPRIRIEFGPGLDKRASAGSPSAGQEGPHGTVAMGATATPLGAGKLAAPPAPPAPRAVAAERPPAQAVQPVQAPQAGRRVGQKTIAQLISSAVATARGSGGRKMNTQALSVYVDRQVGAATATQRRTTLFLAVMLFAAIAGLGGLLIWSQWSSDEIDRLRHDLAGLSPSDPRRKEIEGRLGTLHPANASFGRNLYDQNKKGIFMLAAGGQGFCTAFAIRPNVLATNAHCVVAARQHGGNVVALENEGHGDVSFPVSDMRAHPAYRAADPNALTPDVGIATLGSRTAVVLTMASAQELAAVGAGDDVYLIGFPGRLMDTSNPAATFLGAHVGRVTTAGGRPGGFADSWLLQHDAPTTHGTSGSPIFNGRGHVIGINSGGYLEGDEETVSGRKTEVVRASPYKFGMRIDLINALLR